MSKCRIPSCTRPVYVASRQLCSAHYNRLIATGSTDDTPKSRAPLSERVWRHIERRGPDECWPWTSKHTTNGYGYIGRGGRGAGMSPAPRVVWELTHGPIPKGKGHHGMVVMHTCDNRLCCNPAHLRLGTQAENVRDMDKKGRRVSTPHHGEAHGMAKHTEAQIRAIKRDTGTPTEVARRHGVPVYIVKNIRYKNAWKDVN